MACQPQLHHDAGAYLLPYDSLRAEDECIRVICQYSVNDSRRIHLCELCFCFAGSLVDTHTINC